MTRKRVFISSRIGEMRDFREAAIRAIEQAGMQTVFVASTEDSKRFPLKLGIPVKEQLLEQVRSSDVFVGIYGNTLDPNWVPTGETMHIMELEYEAALSGRLPCLCYVTPTESDLDNAMIMFRRRVMQRGVEFLSSPAALYNDLSEQLSKLKPSVFISYSSKDQNFVNRLGEKLRSSGEYSWLNTESIPKGEQWYDEMVQGLEETNVLILVLSPDSVRSQWVEQEWKTFHEMGRVILPVLYRECEVPAAINKLQMINTEKEDWYFDLLKALRARS